MKRNIPHQTGFSLFKQNILPLHRVYFLYKYYASYSADVENNLFKPESAVYKKVSNFILMLSVLGSLLNF